MTKRRRNRSWQMIIQAKKVYCQLHDPYRAYGSQKEALKQNSETDKGDWHRFDSKGEYNRFIFLYECQKDGDISNLMPHPITVEISPQLILPKNTLRPKKRKRQRRVYTPDFCYNCNGITVYEDYKGNKAKTQDTLRHTLFIKYLIDIGTPVTNFHFKVVTDIAADPRNE